MLLSFLCVKHAVIFLIEKSLSGYIENAWTGVSASMEQHGSNMFHLFFCMKSGFMELT